MSRIFLSHSSRDEREAIALKQWLKDQGWDDVFLDVDPERGLVAGERWQNALKQAADRCEAVVFIVSPDWAKSKWCLAEFLLAKSLNKRIFGAMLKEVPIGELPTEMTSEWQLAMLIGEGPTESVRFDYKGTQAEVQLLAEGLKRLEAGLKKAGFLPDFFPWPPKDDPQRSPYRGLQPLEIRDAAVFFGRDTEILQGLDALRGMRGDTSRKLFVILGASGAGKSSFLRAGLLPRLQRDDRHFLALPVIRPQGAPITGKTGLAQALHDAADRFGIRGPTLGQLKKALKESPAALPGLLDELRAAAGSRLVDTAGESTPAPTVVIPVDQGEELFSSDAGDEAKPFLKLLADELRQGDESSGESKRTARTIVLVTIRSDRYEPLQTAPELVGIRSQVFDELKPMPPTRFREVITGPAKRASIEGGKLEVRPDLVERLVSECTIGGDTLPLLGLTLERLYCDYGSDGDLRLDEYEAMGGLARIVKTEAESVLSRDPAQQQIELELLHGAFIPWLVTINPQNNQPMRRVARRSDLPEASRPLVDALADRRLLLTDQREGEPVVEVAHEAIFRQWDVLAGWIGEHVDDFRIEEGVERAASEWNARKDLPEANEWLLRGERLKTAEELAGKPGFRERLDQCREFLAASRRFEEAERAEQERRRNAELEAAQKLAEEQRKLAEEQRSRASEAERNEARQRKLTRIASTAALITVVLGLVAVWQWLRSEQQRTTAEARQIASEALLEMDHNFGRALLLANASTLVEPSLAFGLGRLMADAPRRDRPIRAARGTLLKSLQSHNKLTKILYNKGRVNSVDFSPNGEILASASDAGQVTLWDTKSFEERPIEFDSWGSVMHVAFSPDGKMLAAGLDNGGVALCELDIRKGNVPSASVGCGRREGRRVIFSPNGQILAVAHEDFLSIESVEDRQYGTTSWGHGINDIAFGPESNIYAVALRSPLWGVQVRCLPALLNELSSATCPIDEDLNLVGHHVRDNHGFAHGSGVNSVAFSSDGLTLASGGDDGSIILWDLRSKDTPRRILRGHNGPVRSVRFFSWPSGHQPPSSSATQVPGLKSAQPNPPAMLSVEGGSERRYSIEMLVSAGDDGSVILWDVEGGAQFGEPLRGHGSAAPGSDVVNAISVSSNGRTIASASNDGTVILWDLEGRKPLGESLRGTDSGYSDLSQSHETRKVALSNDGQMRASVRDDGAVVLWDVASDKMIGELLDRDGAAVGVAFSPDDKTLLSVGDDGKVVSWDVSLESWRNRACAIANRNLTCDEWRDYLGARPYRKICENSPEPDC